MNPKPSLRIFISFLFFILPLFFEAQGNKADSLRTELRGTLLDSMRLKKMLQLAKITGKQNTDSGAFYFEKCLDFADKKIAEGKDKKYYQFKKGQVLVSYGFLFYNIGNLKKAEPFFKRSLEIRTVIDDKPGMAQAMNNLGNCYLSQALYDVALSYYLRSLKILEQSGSKKEIANCFNNMAIAYENKNMTAKSLECHKRSLKVKEEMNDTMGICQSLNNIAIVYESQGMEKEALENFEKSLELAIKTGDKKAMALGYSNVAIIYSRNKRYKEAEEYNRKALELRKEENDLPGIAMSLYNIGQDNEVMKKYNEALGFYRESLKISEEIGEMQQWLATMQRMAYTYYVMGDISDAEKTGEITLKKAQELNVLLDVRDAAGVLKSVYEKRGRFQKALEMYQLFISMRDSIRSDENKNAALKKQYEIELNSKEREMQLKSETEKKILEQKQENERKRSVIFISSVSVILLLVSVFAVIVFRSLQRNRKSSEIIGRQKELVEQKQKEVMDSILYAKRLQDAILPSDESWNSMLPESFLYYQPKDIVAGDFYWMESSSAEFSAQDASGKASDLMAASYIFVAVADCTGHGVPGAMVSVVCSNALNRAVHEFKLTDPGQILDKTRELVISTFEKNDADVKDGMDISLLAMKQSKKGTEISWAGANSPLWFFSGGELQQVKPDKQPIGKFMHQNSFTTHKIDLKKGEMVYMSSDGFADQFGGPDGKKFKYKQLTALLSELHESPMAIQREKIRNTFENWKGDREQVDDVCIVGIRI